MLGLTSFIAPAADRSLLDLSGSGAVMRLAS
jgi:hypothetical protein